MANRYTNTVDSFPVDEHMMRVSGRVDVRHSDANLMPYDGEVLVVMLGRMTTPSYSESKEGDVIRVNVMKPIEVRVVKDLKDRRKMMEGLNFDHEAQLVFTEVKDGPETGTTGSPITLLDMTRPRPEPEVEDDGVEEDVAVEGQSVPLVGWDDEYADPIVLGDDDDEPFIDDSPIEDDYTVEGEDEPMTDEEEAEFLRQFMGVSSRNDRPDRRVRIKTHDSDPILKNFLESV